MYVLAVPCLHQILDVMFNFFIEVRTAYSFCSAVILSGGYASNGAATHGSQSDGDSSNTTVSLVHFLVEVGHKLVNWSNSQFN